MGKIIIDEALNEMARTSGLPVGVILHALISDPNGAAAIRFREYVALGIAAAKSAAYKAEHGVACPPPASVPA